MKTTTRFNKQIEKITLRLQSSTRGGGIEIDLTTFGFKGHKMSAYQNYLGGGMLGAIQCNDTIRHANDTKAEIIYSSEKDLLNEISELLMRYFHDLTNHSEDEWESAYFAENQNRPSSAY